MKSKSSGLALHHYIAVIFGTFHNFEDHYLTLVYSIKLSWKLIIYFSMKIKNSDYTGDPLHTFQVFRWCESSIFSLYIKTNTL